MGKRLDFIKHAWNAFISLDIKTDYAIPQYGGGAYGGRPDRTRLTIGNERSIISSIYSRIGIDVSMLDVRHCRADDGSYVEDIDSGLNECLQVQANPDQFARAFKQDLVMSLLDEGCIAIVPVDTTENPFFTGAWDVKTLRVGRVVTWYPYHVRVSVWNQKTQLREEVTLEKKFVAVIENPMYSVMNEPNSTLRRLITKLNMLDAVDEASSSGKLDLIIQLPYVVKNETKKAQAEQRRQDIEFQLKGSKYGIAYTDGTEKITQLNRPAENNLLEQIKYLTDMLYGQLGLTDTIMNGTADEATMLNYFTRTIEPIIQSIVEGMRACFLTKTARAQGQTVLYFRDAFKLVPISLLGDVMDVTSRNEIMSANDWRPVLGLKPSKDPKADQLNNSNMPQPVVPAASDNVAPADDGSGAEEIFNGAMGQANDSIDEILSSLGADTHATA